MDHINPDAIEVLHKLGIDTKTTIIRSISKSVHGRAKDHPAARAGLTVFSHTVLYGDMTVDVQQGLQFILDDLACWAREAGLDLRAMCEQALFNTNTVQMKAA